MKARLKFSKVGAMRFIGHLDVMRYFQKAFRRADIAISYSQGFSPHQLMSFASPLGIGLSSDAEYLDIVLDDDERTEGFVDRINAEMNDEIRVKEFTVLEQDVRPSMAVLAACDYLAAVKPGRESFLADLQAGRRAVAELCGRAEIPVVKKTKRSESVVDIRKYIYALTGSPQEFARVVGREHGGMALDLAEYTPVLYMQLTAGSVINIKPELVLEALCGQAGEEYDGLSYQIHRLEMYADAGAKKGEVHTLASDPPCRLVPLSEYGRKRGDCIG